jgi:hypothetical protein
MHLPTYTDLDVLARTSDICYSRLWGLMKPEADFVLGDFSLRITQTNGRDNQAQN